jgi:hypothetical protein
MIRLMAESSKKVADTIEQLRKDRILTDEIYTEPLDAAWLVTLSDESRKNILADRYDKKPYNIKIN